MSDTVTLTLPEWSAIVDAAWLRIVSSAAQRLNHSTTYSRGMIERLGEEVTGAAGELAVGKWSGRFFVPSVGTFHRVPDCLGNVEVRSTRHSDGHLIVRDNDATDRRYILAIVGDDSVRLAGWMVGLEARRDEWRRASQRSDRPAWWVPQGQLRSMGDW